MRMFHYPDTGVDEQGKQPDGVMGQGEHQDAGLRTLILQDAVGGLEYKHFGRWYPVMPVPNSLVVNGGDWMHELHPELLSPVHRVLAQSTQERYSFVYLYQMAWRTLENHEHDWLRDL